MATDDTFKSCFRQLGRSRRKVEDLRALEARLLKVESFEMVHEEHWLGVKKGKALKIRLKEPFPEEIEDLATEAIDALRSALDQATFASAVTLGEKDDPKSAYFPFADTEAGLRDVIARRCKDLHPDIVALLVAFKPFQGGNNLLWAMNKARNKGQHATLVTLGTQSQSATFERLQSKGPGPFNLHHLHWDVEKRECLVATYVGGEPIIDGLKMDMYLAFANASVLSGEPVIGAVNTLCSEIERILMAVKAETERLMRVA